MSDDTTTSKPATTATPPAEDGEWTTVSEEREDETKLDFWNIGDQFTGDYLGFRSNTGFAKQYRQYRFRAEDGNVYFAAGASLDEAMAKVSPGNRVRITLTGYQDTGQPTPMSVFKVEVARGTMKPAQRHRSSVIKQATV